VNRLAILACVILAIGALAGCGPRTSVPPPTSPVEGVVTKVESTGLNEVASFDLRTANGTIYTFEIGDLENPVDFPPGHLREHMATSSLVRVFFDVDGDRFLVTRLEDAD
jgi:hypothetical protein